MISSAQNTQVKNVIKLNQKAKARREQGLFIAEGRKMFLEAPDDWIEKVYVAESLLDDAEIMHAEFWIDLIQISFYLCFQGQCLGVIGADGIHVDHSVTV